MKNILLTKEMETWGSSPARNILKVETHSARRYLISIPSRDSFHPRRMIKIEAFRLGKSLLVNFYGFYGLQNTLLVWSHCWDSPFSRESSSRFSLSFCWWISSRLRNSMTKISIQSLIVCLKTRKILEHQKRHQRTTFIINHPSRSYSTPSLALKHHKIWS